MMPKGELTMGIKKAFPKELFVVWEDAGNDTPFLRAGTVARDFAEAGEASKVGLYRLVDVKTLTAKLVLS